MLDEENGPPAPAPLRRTCTKPECGATARPGGRYCRRCAAQASARWYEATRAQILARRQGKRDDRTDDERARDNARAYVAVYLRRGKITRGRCAVCNEFRVSPTWADPRRPLEVRWLCREHLTDARDAAAAVAHDRAELRDEHAALRAAIAALPPAVQRELHDTAMRGTLVRKAGDLMYWWNMRRAFAALTL